MYKNEIIVETCFDYDEKGFGVVKHNGFIVFVKDLLISESAEIKIISVKKNYAYGIISKLLVESKERITPKCSVFSKCGGCNLQHMSDKEQAFFKEKRVKDCFKTISNLDVKVNSIISGTNYYRYRNKVQIPCTFDKNYKLGFYREHSNDIVIFDDCLVQSVESNKIIDFLKDNLYVSDVKNDLRHIIIKQGFNTNEFMLVFVVRKDVSKKLKVLVDRLLDNFNNIISILLNINSRDDNVILGVEEIVLYNRDFIVESLLGNNFKISLKSFFQINVNQTEKLYNLAISLAKLNKSDTLIDLYCGIGTIGIIASKYCKYAYGIEIVKEAIEDAKINAINNNINNIEFLNMDASIGSKYLIDNNINPNVIIVDPPRKGLDNNTIDSILKLNPDRFIYISCNPATLARDINYFKDSYKIEVVQPVDMFPNTSHVETVVLLSKLNTKNTYQH